MSNCNNINPLTRSGTSQKQRLLQALQKDYVGVDERTPADLLIFARRFAGQLRYYDLNNQLRGDWSEFFSNDVSFLIAILTNNDTTSFREKWEELTAQLEVELDDLFTQVDGSGDLLAAVKNDLPTAIPTFKKLFDYTWSLAAHLDAQTSRLPERTGLQDFATATIAKDCSLAFKKLLGLYKAAINQGSADYVFIDAGQQSPFGAVAGIRQRYTQDILTNGLSSGWLPTDKEWQDFFDNDINAGDYKAAFGQNVPAVMVRPEHVGQRLLPALQPIRAIFDTLINVFEKLAAAAPEYLERTLEDWPDHEPHIALYLAFIRLFRFAQQHINGLKDRHLDYYLKEVLRLKEKPAQPDEAHLLFTLAKHVEDHLLASGTAFKAGKDSEKKEVSYTAVGNTELNKAIVTHLRSIYHTPSDGRIYAAPDADSEDGQGEELVAEDGQWKPFGPVSRFAGPEGNPVEPVEDEKAIELFKLVSQPAPAGFAVASPNLFLKEGTRVITIELTLAEVPEGFNGKAWNVHHFNVLLTGEKEWIEKAPDLNPRISGGKFKITCTLGPEDPAVLPYQSDVHGGGFNTSYPLVKILIGEETLGNSPYVDLQKLRITSVTTTVDVTGVKDVVLQNDLGRLDPAKPFQPFGAIPRTGSALYVGSKEIFQKKLSGKLEIKMGWDGLGNKGNIYKPVGNVNVEIKNLNGQADSKSLISSNLVPQNSLSVTDSKIAGYGRENLRNFDFSENRPYTTTTKKGFIRLELKNQFGHAAYPNKFAEAASQLASDPIKFDRITDLQFKEGGVITLKEPPYTPLFNAFSLNYKAVSTFSLNTANEQSFDNREEQFFHLHPFGQREMHPHLAGSGASVDLVPPFEYEGNLYIGLANAKPRQTVSILLQAAEGSANPLKKRQTVEWHYLHDNHWHSFSNREDALITDGTGDLLRSGIVVLQLPRKISDSNTWLDAGMTWIRAAVKTDTDAVCNLLTVNAQAAKVRFADNGNAVDFLETPLAAGIIKKLVNSDSAIKKTEQPYTAFGNRPEEKPDQFYRRVSERLRHKNRAITMWDYERLVLEAFPDIYKVKCLNHTRLMPQPADETKLVDNEIAPGYVLVVTLPDLKNRNAVNPLLPNTSLGTLEDIKTFLQKRISPHVRLEVVNPRFEQIQLEFQVQYRPGFPPSIYDRILAADITQFLSPWAFENVTDREIGFGGRLHKSVVLDYVEEREYVDFVVQFKMHLFVTEGDDQEDIEEAVATTGRSVLVSHAKHLINLQPLKC